MLLPITTLAPPRSINIDTVHTMFCCCHGWPWKLNSGTTLYKMILSDKLRICLNIWLNTHTHPHSCLTFWSWHKLKSTIPSLIHSKNKSASAPSVYCFNHIHLDTATINKIAMGEIHCMYTSTNKPLVSVLLVHYIEAALLFVHIWMSSELASRGESADKRCSMNRHSWLAFVSVTLWKDDRPNSGKENRRAKKKKNKRTPSKNKSVTTANVECLFNYKHDTD